MYKASSTAWIAPGPEIMELPHRLDSSTALSFAEDAILCITSGAHEMVLDAGRLTNITAAGTRAILTVAKALHDKGGRLVISHMNPQVKEFLNVAGFDFVLDNEDHSSTLTQILAA